MEAVLSTTIETYTRRIVDDAASQLLEYLGKLPEAGSSQKAVLETARVETHARIRHLQTEIARYLGTT
jgi:hypothetical protein